jgi:ABC-2 type transport system permease protein
VTSLTGTWRLTRLALRRDRVRLALWVGGIAALVVIQAVSVLDVYPDQAAIELYVELFGGNPALVALAGPGYGFDDPNIGVVLVNEIQVFACLATALMSILLVNRYTRVEEDTERADLLRSTIVGRHAPTAAAVVVVGAANVLVAVLCTAGVVALDFPLTGSIALSASFAAVGLVFAGVTAVAAQVASGGRGTLAGTSAVLGAAFVIRMAGDIAKNGLSWLSPIGWGQAVRAYAHERWWTLGLCVVAAAALVVCAFWLSTKRDLGSGLRAQRAGPERAARSLTTPLGLAVRLQRGALAGWLIGMLGFGIVFGSIGEDVDTLFEENPAMAEIFSTAGVADPTDSYLATSLMMLTLIAGGWSVSATLRLHGEESAGRVESILASRVSRARWAASHLAVAAAGTLLAVAAAGLGVGIAYGIVSGDASQVLRLTGASLVLVPGMLVLIGLTALLHGVSQRAAPAAWGALTVVLVVGIFAELLQLPDWARVVSPLEHLPSAPAEPVTVTPILALLALAAALTAAGLWALRRRDLQLH